MALTNLITCILFSIQISFSHEFSTTSPVRTTVTSTFSDGRMYSPSFNKMTSIFLSAGAFEDFFGYNDSDDDDHEDNNEGEDDDVFRLSRYYSSFDIDSAREQLESLVGAGSLPIEDDHHEASSSIPQQLHLRSTLPNIRLLKDEDSEISPTIAISAGASIASSPSMFDVTEPPPLSIDLPHRPPMTAIERERRLAEIELLRNILAEDDQSGQAISDLWSLWFAERGPQAEAVLKEADALMGGGTRDQLEAERILRSLIEEYGVYFVEPINRLATLYFAQGRMEESLALNKVVLAAKPWHIGALSHIVMVYEALGDSMMARSWARFRLPNGAPMGNNKRRQRWVEWATQDAMRLLEQGEVSNAMSFGESDQDWIERQPSRSSSPSNNNFENFDAWQ